MSAISRRTFSALSALAAFGPAFAPAVAQTVEQFYKGRTITILVPTSPGGNFDLNARLVARHLGRFVPGQPGVVVQNLPGAGGLLLANQFMNTRDRDGLTIGVMERGTPQMAYEGDANARFDPLKFNWIGSLSSYANDAYLLLVNDGHPARTIEDLRKPGVVARLGGDTPGSTNLTFAILARDLLKLNIKVVRGYAGASRMFIAMEGGELDGQVIGLGSVRGAQPTLWNGKKVRPLLQFGRLSRLPELADVPTARERLTDPDDLALLQFAELSFFIALPFLAPPDVPSDRVDALRRAFMEMTRDPVFLDDARKANFELSPIDGVAVRDVVRRMSATPQSIIKRYVDIVRSNRD
jgi:tripartite-type tricarboxylate transporter receptor subunit TctC